MDNQNVNYVTVDIWPGHGNFEHGNFKHGFPEAIKYIKFTLHWFPCLTDVMNR